MTTVDDPATWPFEGYDSLNNEYIEHGAPDRLSTDKMRSVAPIQEYYILVVDGYTHYEVCRSRIPREAERVTTRWNETCHPFLHPESDSRRVLALQKDTKDMFVAVLVEDELEYEIHDGDQRFQVFPHPVAGVIEVATK